MLIYGLSRSPTRAHFQNIPKSLSPTVSPLDSLIFLDPPIAVIALHWSPTHSGSGP